MFEIKLTEFLHYNGSDFHCSFIFVYFKCTPKKNVNASCQKASYRVVQSLAKGDEVWTSRNNLKSPTLHLVGFEVLAAIIMKSIVFWDVTLCTSPLTSL
jgi:hypothetical protein